MKISEIFEKAAEKMEDFSCPLGCCLAISLVSYSLRTSTDARIYFSQIYEEDSHPDRRGGFYWGTPTEADRQVRIQALLFAAELAKDEGL